MQETKTWRTVLKEILKNPEERKKIAHELHTSEMTLKRWSEGKSKPQLKNLHQLLTILPEHRSLLLPLIIQQFPELSKDLTDTDEVPKEIASAFYAEVLQMLTSATEIQDIWSILDTILNHLLVALEQGQAGITITIAFCVPPLAGGKVRSLQVFTGVGWSPWGDNLKQQRVFFGAESLAGRVVSFGQPLIIQQLQMSRFIQEQSKKEGSVSSLSIYPLQRAGRIAGILYISSSQTDYFLSPRLNLIQQYAHLLSLTLAPENFYAPAAIHLHMVPPPPLQLSYLATFRERVFDLLRKTISSQQSMTHAQAEQMVWQAIEDELIKSLL